MNDRHSYFVSFAYNKNGCSGISNCSIDIDHKIDTFTDIEEVTEILKSKFEYYSVCILYYKEISSSSKNQEC